MNFGFPSFAKVFFLRSWFEFPKNYALIKSLSVREMPSGELDRDRFLCFSFYAFLYFSLYNSRSIDSSL